MINLVLSIEDLNRGLAHILELMLMFFGPVVGLVMIYVGIGRPMLRAVRRARLNEREKQVEHQKLMNYKYNDQYNAQSTKAGLEKRD